MDQGEFFWLGAAEVPWLKQILNDHASLQNFPRPGGGRGIPLENFVRLMGRLGLNLGTVNVFDLAQEQNQMSQELQQNRITRIELFFRHIQTCVEANGAINVGQLSRYLHNIGMRMLSQSINRLFVHFSLPIRTNELEFQGDEIIYRLYRPNEQIVADSVSHSALMVASNAIIVDNIFSFLPHESRLAFRATYQMFREHTMGSWLRSCAFRVYSHDGGVTTMCECIRPLSANSLNFASLLQTTRNDAQFRNNVNSLYVSYRQASGCNRSTEHAPLLSNPGEIDYWRLYGANIVNLKICCASFGRWFNTNNRTVELKMEWLLVRACPNLQSLQLRKTNIDFQVPERPANAGEIGLPENSQQQSSSTSNNLKLKNVKNPSTHAMSQKDPKPSDPSSSGNEHRVNLNMRCLKIRLLESRQILKDVLSMVPNLQELHLENIHQFELLLRPTFNREYIRLSHLELRYGGAQFVSLREYTNMFPETLRVLNFERLDMLNLRFPPYSLYASLGNCVNLTRLRLHLHVPHTLLQHWYYDLSQFVYPMLESLEIIFAFNHHRLCVVGAARFDFNSIKNYQNLQNLAILYQGWGDLEQIREGNHEDYLFTGDRENYIPEGTTPHFPNTETPLLCTNLRKLAFNCWRSNAGDIANYFLWFPHLQYIHVRGDQETIDSLVVYAGNLRRLMIESMEIISLRNLRPLQATNLDLKILVKIINDNTIYKIVVQNGRLKFEIAEIGEWTLN